VQADGAILELVGIEDGVGESAASGRVPRLFRSSDDPQDGVMKNTQGKSPGVKEVIAV